MKLPRCVAEVPPWFGFASLRLMSVVSLCATDERLRTCSRPAVATDGRRIRPALPTPRQIAIGITPAHGVAGAGGLACVIFKHHRACVPQLVTGRHLRRPPGRCGSSIVARGVLDRRENAVKHEQSPETHAGMRVCVCVCGLAGHVHARRTFVDSRMFSSNCPCTPRRRLAKSGARSAPCSLPHTKHYGRGLR